MSVSDSALFGYRHYYEMLSDRIRMTAFHDAILAAVRPGDVVVDLGAGTGILGLWAIRAGAARVYAIEESNAIDLAVEIAKVNNCEDRITFINQNSLDVTLPEKADVIVTETLGSFAVDENMLTFIDDARRRFLAAGGRLIPQSVELYAAPFSNAAVYEKIDFWRRIPEADFSPAFNLFAGKLMVESIAAADLLCDPISIGRLDLDDALPPICRTQVYMPMQRAAPLHGVAGWFRARLGNGIEIVTSPSDPPTHWRQAVLPFRDPIAVVAGDVLDWSVEIRPQGPQQDGTSISYQYRCTQLANES